MLERFRSPAEASVALIQEMQKKNQENEIKLNEISTQPDRLLKRLPAMKPMAASEPAPVHEPLPLARSPITFAGLIPAVREGVLSTEELEDVVMALVEPRELSRGILVEQVDGTGQRRPDDMMMADPEVTAGHRVKMVLAGTNALSFRPPDRCVGLGDGYAGLGVAAGTDVRCFWCPPDGAERVEILMSIAEVGTDVRGFCHPPDPNEETTRSDLMMCLSPAGTMVRGFRVPPDGCGSGLCGRQS